MLPRSPIAASDSRLTTACVGGTEVDRIFAPFQLGSLLINSCWCEGLLWSLKRRAAPDTQLLLFADMLLREASPERATEMVKERLFTVERALGFGESIFTRERERERRAPRTKKLILQALSTGDGDDEQE